MKRKDVLYLFKYYQLFTIYMHLKHLLSTEISNLLISLLQAMAFSNLVISESVLYLKNIVRRNQESELLNTGPLRSSWAKNMVEKLIFGQLDASCTKCALSRKLLLTQAILANYKRWFWTKSIHLCQTVLVMNSKAFTTSSWLRIQMKDLASTKFWWIQSLCRELRNF